MPCEACGKYGHPAVQCDFMGMFLSARHWLKNAPAEEIRAIEDRWCEKNRKWTDGDRDVRGKPWLNGQRDSPRSVTEGFAKHVGMDLDELDAQFDHSFFLPDDDDPDLGVSFAEGGETEGSSRLE